jgi:hypothetical protein
MALKRRGSLKSAWYTTLAASFAANTGVENVAAQVMSSIDNTPDSLFIAITSDETFSSFIHAELSIISFTLRDAIDIWQCRIQDQDEFE